MTPVYQTPGHYNGGNCLQAAIASLLDIELDAVPNFVDPEDGSEGDDISWFRRMVEWCRVHRIGVISLSFGDHLLTLDGMHLIAIGKTQKGTYHAVVVRAEWLPDKETVNLKAVHDPNPSHQFIDGIHEIIGLVPNAL